MSPADIIASLEKLTGPSREVDAEIVAFLNNATVKPYPPTDDFGPKNRWQFWSQDGKHFLGSEGKFPVPELTGSLDAIVALIEQKLPGWCNSSIRDETGCEAYIWSRAGGKHVEIRGVHQHRAIAMCICLLKALESGQ